MSTIASMFAANVAAAPAQPMLTWYDQATGERTELSGATLANWVSKTANMLVDGLGLGAGDVSVVDLPPHWQSAAIMLASWTVGLKVITQGKGDVSFGLPQSGADYAVGLHPFALPTKDAQDWVLSARVHGDYYGGPPADPDAPAWNELTHAELAAEAKRKGLSGRVLINVDTTPDVVDWLLAPVAGGASMVLCRNADEATIARWAEMERVPPKTWGG